MDLSKELLALRWLNILLDLLGEHADSADDVNQQRTAIFHLNKEGRVTVALDVDGVALEYHNAQCRFHGREETCA